ncbi:hypothetical protein ARMSODRAFT_980719 [Armillaria solidipes]|uniref:Uncharacterized protein n=1 Tax=Armillaria solidipes TaxID=1076256 RepID=A0A2H3AUL3_9AGAR|nr:hypothetical protein ARMSODRAFT_980719 [Armillaria solidipes]
MTAGTYLGTAMPGLTDSQIKDLFVALDIQFNDTMLCAFLYVLYFCGGFNLYAQWVLDISYFTTSKWESFWEAVESTPDNSAPVTLTSGIGAILSTVLADASLIWRCWIVWASRGIVTYYTAFGSSPSLQVLYVENIVSWSLLYSSLILATLLWCTILIIYRILRVGGAVGRIHVYQRVIEMLVESASLYSAVIVVLLVFEVRNALAAVYLQEFAIAMRGIMPTILVGRVAAGHARPDDSWSQSAPRSSLRFGNQSSLQNDTQMSVGSGQDTLSRVRPDVEEGLEESTESVERKICKPGKFHVAP